MNQLRQIHKYFYIQVYFELKAFFSWLVVQRFYLNTVYLHVIFCYNALCTQWIVDGIAKALEKANTEKKNVGYFEDNICILRLIGICNFVVASSIHKVKLCMSLQGNRGDQANRSKQNLTLFLSNTLKWLRTVCKYTYKHFTLT